MSEIEKSIVGNTGVNNAPNPIINSDQLIKPDRDKKEQSNPIVDFLKIITNLASTNFFSGLYKDYFPDKGIELHWYSSSRIFKWVTLILEILFRCALVITLICTLLAGFILLLDTVGIAKKEDIGCIFTTFNLDYCRGLRKDPEEKSVTALKSQSSQSSKSNEPTPSIPLKDRGSKYITIPAFIPSE